MIHASIAPRPPLAVLLASSILLALPLAAPPRAQEPVPAAAAAQTMAAPARDSVLAIAKYLDYETVGDPRISPDGSQLVYTRRHVDVMNDRWKSSLWIMNADGSRNRFLAEGSGAVWSPDGRRIAYLADGEPKGSQIFVRWIDAEGPSTQVTRATESVGDVRWSPDGAQLGFTMFVPSSDPWKIAMPSAPKGAKWTEPPRHVTTLHYRADRRGFLEPGDVHLFVVPADGGTPRQLTSGRWSVGYRFDGLPGAVAWDWTPDGRTIVVEGFADSTADRSYRESQIHAVDVATAARRTLTRERGMWTGPVVSPNGRWVAFTGHPYGRESYRAEDVWVMAIDGSGVRKLSGTLDRDPSSLTWARDNSGVYFAAGDSGTSNVLFASLDGRVRAVTTGTHMLALGSVSNGGVAVGVRTSFRQPPDIVRFPLAGRGGLTQLTRVNEDVLAGVRLGEVEPFWYRSTGGARVQGWIVKPPHFDASRKYPLILEIHGGPHSMYTVGFNFAFQNFAANDFLVLYTNPRGSTGYGSAFGNAIERAYPSVDYDDLMAGVDSVIARGIVDTTRMFVGGCSGGGVLSSWVIGHTNRFAAAAVRCPVIDWMSFAGQTDVPLFTYNFFDKPFWEDPARWIEQSPLSYVGNVTTPTLIMTGVLDLRTPMAQSEEYYAALAMRGVPAALLRFEGEYHGTGSRPSNFMRTQLYMMDWYKRWGGTRRWTPEPLVGSR
jgi:dipeptidyl aminopeptidase/acylaminoacyl peptidase